MIRELSSREEASLSFLTGIFPDTSTLILTKTGLEKGIMDATIPLRANLKQANIHDYDQQGKGPDSKVLLKSFIWNGEAFIDSQCSLYRPETKDGDPRIWFYGLKSYVNADNALGVIPFDGSLYVIALSTFEADVSGNHPFFIRAQIEGAEIAIELLEKMKVLARDWIPSIRVADCGIGDTLEARLGIKQNSSRNPDYKGIELKAKRVGSKTRDNLFAQVPNWNISPIKSSFGILERFGYIDPETQMRKLYVTVNAIKPNNQGLSLRVNYRTKTLDEVFNIKGKEIIIVKWDFSMLLDRLLSKHKETFWIKAVSHKAGDEEFLLYTSIEHTKKPIIENFFRLIESGDITVDHLIKEKGKSAVEKGPIFKLRPNSFEKLFPRPMSYTLVEKEILEKRKLQILELMSK